jgi:hypothetical protein
VSGVPAYREPKRPSPRKCRRHGGHYQSEGFVDFGGAAVWSYVCGECGVYLGPILPAVSPYNPELDGPR